MSNSFCRHLSNALRLQITNNNIKAVPCCFFSGKSVDILPYTPGAIENYRTEINQITDYFSAHGACNQCRSIEDSGYTTSMRQRAFRDLSEGTSNEILMLELQLSNKCNAACIMCGPVFSSQWELQNNKFVPDRHTINFDDRSTVPRNSREIDIDLLLDSLDLTKLQVLKISGGEPFYDHESYIKILERVPHPENVMVSGTTNGSIYPNEKIFELWSKFRTVKLLFSIDAVGQRFNYVRWPLQWHQVDNNIRRLKEQVELSILATMNPFNIYYVDEIEDWILDMYPEHTRESIYTRLLGLNPATFTKFSLDATPPTLREACYKKFGKDHRVSRLLNETGFNVGLEKISRAMTTYASELDQYRNQTPWQEVFSEVADHFLPATQRFEPK